MGPDKGAPTSESAGITATLTRMTAKEADQFGIDEALRKSIIRLDDAKPNLAPPGEAVWFRLVSVDIGNATADYPRGDNVQTVERWYPPDIWGDLDTVTINQILDRIDAGLPEGRAYSGAAQATRRGAWAVVKEFRPHLTKEQAQQIVDTWLKNGVLITEECTDPKTRIKGDGLRVGKRPGDTWD